MSYTPSTWLQVLLKELISHIESGKSFTCEERPPQDNEYGVIKISAVTWGEYDENESKTCMDESLKRDELLVRSGDFLLSRANTSDLVGACVIADNVNKKIMLSDKILRIGFHEVEKRWIMHALRTKSAREQIAEAASGNQLSMKNISQDKLGSIQISLAPLNEQRRIVAKLDALLDRIRRARDEVDEVPPLIEKFRQAALTDAFSHGESFLLGQLIEGVKYGTSTKCEYGTSGVAVLRIPNIGERVIVAADLKYAALTEDEQSQYSLRSGDVLVIRSNGSADLVGKAALIHEDETKYSFAGYLMRIRPRQELINPNWLIFALCSPALREQILLTSKSTSGVNNINSEELRNLKLRVPPLAEQKEIVRRIESLFSRADALSAEVKAARERLDVLEQAVLAKAFRGELVPQDPNDEPASVLLERIRAQRAEGESEGSSKRGRGRPRKAADVRG